MGPKLRQVSKRIRLRGKLTALAMLTSIVAVGCTTLGLMAYELVWFRADLAARSAATADIVGSNTAVSLAFSDESDVRQTLSSLSHDRSVLRAYVLDRNWRLVAMYDRTRPTDAISKVERFAPSKAGALTVRPIDLRGEIVGYIHIESDANQFFSRVRTFAGITLAVVFVSVILAYAAARRLQKAISSPLMQLEGAARQVSASRDYSIRVTTETHDEVGELARAFNAMLQEIEDRDLQLSQWSNELSAQVQARTKALREANEQLVVAKERAEAAAKAKSEFLAAMSHEIRTPLNGVIGMTSILLDAELPSQERECVQTIRTSGEALLTIINDILDISKIEAGRLELESIPFQVRNVMSDAVDLLSESARRKKLPISLDISPDVPAVLTGDPGRLRQILLNLLNNAVKFTERGHIQMRALVESTTPGAVALRIEVVDTGIGIAPEKRKLLFRPFTQADSSTTRRFGGTGLGLAICSRIVEAMGGEIGMESTVGEGSLFWFRVKMGVAAPSAVGAEDLLEGGLAKLGRATGDTLRDPGCRRPARILVAEDNTTNQRLLQIMLKRAGHHVDTVPNGMEAVRAAESNSYDLILMDCNMPELDGYEASRRILEAHERKTQPAIVALTANALAGDRERCLDAGMSDYLTKPITAQVLAQALDKWLPRTVVNADVVCR